MKKCFFILLFFSQFSLAKDIECRVFIYPKNGEMVNARGQLHTEESGKWLWEGKTKEFLYSFEIVEPAPGGGLEYTLSATISNGTNGAIILRTWQKIYDELTVGLPWTKVYHPVDEDTFMFFDCNS